MICFKQWKDIGPYSVINVLGRFKLGMFVFTLMRTAKGSITSYTIEQMQSNSLIRNNKEKGITTMVDW